MGSAAMPNKWTSDQNILAAQENLKQQVAQGLITQQQADAELSRQLGLIQTPGQSHVGSSSTMPQDYADPNLTAGFNNLKDQVAKGWITQAQADAEMNRLIGNYQTQESQLGRGEALPDNQPPVTISQTDPTAAAAAASGTFGKYAGEFNNAAALADQYLPDVAVSTALTQQQQDALNYLQTSAAQHAQGPAANVTESEQYLKNLRDGAGTEDPRITALEEALKSQSEQGLMAPELTAIREAGLEGINGSYETARRQMAINSAGAGRTGGGAMFDAPEITGKFLQSRRDLERDVLAQNIAYKQQQQASYNQLLTSRDTELFGRQATTGQSYADTVARNSSDYWTTSNNLNKSYGDAAQTAANDVFGRAEWNATQAYNKGQAVMGAGVSGVGWQQAKEQQAIANKLASQQIAAMKAAKSVSGFAPADNTGNLDTNNWTGRG